MAGEAAFNCGGALGASVAATALVSMLDHDLIAQLAHNHRCNRYHYLVAARVPVLAALSDTSARRISCTELIKSLVLGVMVTVVVSASCDICTNTASVDLTQPQGPDASPGAPAAPQWFWDPYLCRMEARQFSQSKQVITNALVYSSACDKYPLQLVGFCSATSTLFASCTCWSYPQCNTWYLQYILFAR